MRLWENLGLTKLFLEPQRVSPESARMHLHSEVGVVLLKVAEPNRSEFKLVFRLRLSVVINNETFCSWR